MAPSQSPQSQGLNKACPMSLDSEDIGKGCTVKKMHILYIQIYAHVKAPTYHKVSLYLLVYNLCESIFYWIWGNYIKFSSIFTEKNVSFIVWEELYLPQFRLRKGLKRVWRGELEMYRFTTLNANLSLCPFVLLHLWEITTKGHSLLHNCFFS